MEYLAPAFPSAVPTHPGSPNKYQHSPKSNVDAIMSKKHNNKPKQPSSESTAQIIAAALPRSPSPDSGDGTKVIGHEDVQRAFLQKTIQEQQQRQERESAAKQAEPRQEQHPVPEPQPAPVSVVSVKQDPVEVQADGEEHFIYLQTPQGLVRLTVEQYRQYKEAMAKQQGAQRLIGGSPERTAILIMAGCFVGGCLIGWGISRKLATWWSGSQAVSGIDPSVVTALQAAPVALSESNKAELVKMILDELRQAV